VGYDVSVVDNCGDKWRTLWIKYLLENMDIF
jgi:hypothetical protein